MSLPREADPGASGPLAATLARLAAADDTHSYIAGKPPDSDGTRWHRVAEALDEGALFDRWFRELLEGEAKGLPDVAASLLASYVSGAIADPAIKALTLERRVWPLEADVMAVRHHPEGWFDGIAVRTTRVRVLARDPASDHPDAEVVADDAALSAVVAEELASLATAIFAAVRQRARYGLRGMWGNFVDGIAASAVDLWQGHTPSCSGDARSAYATAASVIDMMAAREPLLRVRPRLDRVDWSGGTEWVAIKGTCCLLYKAFDYPRDPRGEGYCYSCPLREEGSRRAKWASWFADQAVAARGGA